MLRDSEREKEILLGNKQLLGVFFLVVILLGLAFGAGYKLGQGPHRSTAGDEPLASASTNAGGTETRTVGAEGTTATNTDASHPTGTAPSAAPDTSTETPLGARPKSKTNSATARADSEAAGPGSAPVVSRGAFSPQAGQTFLQVAAVGRDEAEAISDVLRKKGFRAHSVPKPGSKLYRVIIGPVRDAGDLSNTRALLRNTGFREIFVQRY